MKRKIYNWIALMPLWETGLYQMLRYIHSIDMWWLTEFSRTKRYMLNLTILNSLKRFEFGILIIIYISLMINRMSQHIEVQSQTKCCSRNVNQVSRPTRFNSFRIIWRRVWIYFFRCILFEYVNTSVICTSPSISTSYCVNSENKKIFFIVGIV